jgi:hypothetical protein
MSEMPLPVPGHRRMAVLPLATAGPSIHSPTRASLALDALWPPSVRIPSLSLMHNSSTPLQSDLEPACSHSLRDWRTMLSRLVQMMLGIHQRLQERSISLDGVTCEALRESDQASPRAAEGAEDRREERQRLLRARQPRLERGNLWRLRNSRTLSESGVQSTPPWSRALARSETQPTAVAAKVEA